MPARVPQTPGRIWLERDGDRAVLHLRGEIDAAAVEAFERAGASETVVTADQPMVLAVDVNGVSFLNSRGVALLATATKPARAAGHRPVLRAAPRQVLRVLDMTGAIDLFDVEPVTAGPEPATPIGS
jgi:anti-anti-sigma factor